MKPYFDFSTQNQFFKNYVISKRSQNNYPLVIFDMDLIGVDPYSDDLTDEQKLKIIEECKRNPAYFIREVARDSDGYKFRLNAGIEAALQHMASNIHFHLNVPNYDQRDDFCISIFLSRCIDNNESMIISNELTVARIQHIKNTYMPKYLSEHINTSRIQIKNCSTINNTSMRGYRIKNVFIDNIGVVHDTLDIVISELAVMKKICDSRGDVGPMCFSTGYIDYKQFKADQHLRRMQIEPNNITSIEEPILYKNLTVIDIDLIEMELNIHDVFKYLSIKMDTLNIKTTLDRIKYFTKEAFGKIYDDLDIVEKININKIYAELDSTMTRKLHLTKRPKNNSI